MGDIEIIKYCLVTKLGKLTVMEDLIFNTYICLDFHDVEAPGASLKHKLVRSFIGVHCCA